jgi:tRNA modification GTPase
VKRIVVHNKIDLSGAPARVDQAPDQTKVYASAKTGVGIDALESALLDAAGWQHVDAAQFLARERHVVALAAAATHIRNASDHLNGKLPALELFAEELRLAQVQLSSITGEFTADDLLGEIFGRFCIGK